MSTPGEGAPEHKNTADVRRFEGGDFQKWLKEVDAEIHGGEEAVLYGEREIMEEIRRKAAEAGDTSVDLKSSTH